MALKQMILNSALRLSGLMSQPQLHHNPQKEVNPVMPALLREAAAQGAVLLENRVLPFRRRRKLPLQRKSFGGSAGLRGLAAQ